MFLLAEVSIGATVGIVLSVFTAIATTTIAIDQVKENRRLQKRALRHAEQQLLKSEQERKDARWEPLAIHVWTKRMDFYPELIDAALDVLNAATGVDRERSNEVALALRTADFWIAQKKLTFLLCRHSMIPTMAVKQVVLEFMIEARAVVETEKSAGNVMPMFNRLTTAMYESVGADSLDSKFENEFLLSMKHVPKPTSSTS